MSFSVPFSLTELLPLAQADPSAPASGLTGLFQLASILASFVLLLIVLELVRRRRLFERYAILWLASALALMGLAVWRPAIDFFSVQVLGIRYVPTTVILIALGFVLMLLLHFSVAVSRLSDQSKVLAQRLALLEEQLRAVGEQTESEPKRAAAGAEPARPWPRPVVAEPPTGQPEGQPVVASSAAAAPRPNG